MMDKATSLRSILDDAFGTLRRHWDDGDFDDVKVVEAGQGIANALSSAYTGMRDATNRVKDGYDGLDVWNLGDTILIRMADLADEIIRTKTYGSLSSELTVEEVRSMAEAFRAYEGSSCIYENTIHINSLKTEEGRRLLDAISNGISDQFITAWDQFGERVFACPVDHDEHGSVPFVVKAVDRIRRKVRIQSMEQARIDELRLMVAMLRAYCNRNYGVPFEYAKKHGHYGHLVDCDKGWKKEPLPLSLRIWGNPDVIGEAETVQEAGADYALYTMDIIRAANGIEAWADWIDGVAHGFSAEASLYPTLATLDMTDLAPDVAHVEEGIRQDFLTAWHWLGGVSLTLWI